MSSSPATSNSAPPKTLDINSLPVAQLSQIQSRLSQELEHLSTSYQRLFAAQTRFKDCIRSIKDGVQGKSSSADGKTTPLLIPLTTSLYVPATLDASKPNTVLVDVGTGFYVGKTTVDAIEFYRGKITDLEKNLKEIGEGVSGKTDTLRYVEDVLRSKVLAGEGGAQGAGTGG